MNATGEDRWRNRGQQNSPLQNQNQNQNQNQQRQQTSRFASGGSLNPKQNTTADPPGDGTGAGAGAGYGPPQDQHVPVRGFNSIEVRDVLKKAYDSGVAEAGKSVKYKPLGGQANNSSTAKSSGGGGPWGTKPNTTANGKDFFLELRKQFSVLQQAGGGGGVERAGG